MCVNAYVQTTYYIYYIIILLPYVYMMHICAVMVHLLQFDKNDDVWYNPCNIYDNVYTETYMGVKCNMSKYERLCKLRNTMERERDTLPNEHARKQWCTAYTKLLHEINTAWVYTDAYRVIKMALHGHM